MKSVTLIEMKDTKRFLVSPFVVTYKIFKTKLERGSGEEGRTVYPVGSGVLGMTFMVRTVTLLNKKGFSPPIRRET